MRVKRVHLTGYKRFTDLIIQGMPEDTRLVVLVGPNGSGKSSLFDAFLLKSMTEKFNVSLNRNDEFSDYYEKTEIDSRHFSHSREVADQIEINFHQPEDASRPPSLAFYIRTAYRLQADFRTPALSAPAPANSIVRVKRIIDHDESVADNYQRLAWKRMTDLDFNAPEDQTFGKYRREAMRPLRKAMQRLFNSPSLFLQDFGITQVQTTFRFTKGVATDFLYKNLSGGEKAAFDLLLDIFVKGDEYGEAIYCIDEPETHLATALHAVVLRELLELLPENAQLWIATHSAGFVREAYQRMKKHDDVVFLDFSNRDFDSPVMMEPTIPDASFWRTMYRVSLADLADLIAPNKIILCEGGNQKDDPGFDADIYGRVFRETHPEAFFFGVGSASEMKNFNVEILISLLGKALPKTQVRTVRDRDEMTGTERQRQHNERSRVLRRREIENYLYDPRVIATFAERAANEPVKDRVVEAVQRLLGSSDVRTADVKGLRQRILQEIKKESGLPNLGNKTNEFALECLAPALASTEDVLSELEEDIFGST